VCRVTPKVAGSARIRACVRQIRGGPDSGNAYGQGCYTS
jgi:hypothetical protein